MLFWACPGKIYGWLVVAIIKPSFLQCMRRDLHPQVPQPWWRMLPKDSRRYGGTSRDGWILLLQWCWQQRAWRLPISHGGTKWIPKNGYSSYYGKSHYKRWFGGTPFEQWSNPQLADDYTGQYTDFTTNQHNQYNGNILIHQGIPYQLTSMMGPRPCAARGMGRPRVLNTVHLGVGNPGRNQGHSLRKICQNTLALNVCLMISVVQP